jgi:hypothetical protein
MNIEIHYADEWAALYLDGKLDRVGDAYLAEEKAFGLLGVKQVQDDAFMRGQNQASGVADTLDEVAEYRRQRDEALTEAARLRAQADELLAKAGLLKQGKA